MATICVKWKLNGAADCRDFPADSLWADVRNQIRLRRPDPKPRICDIHVRKISSPCDFNNG